MLSSASSIFDRLQPRPPTPPRETSQAIDAAIAFLDDSNEIDRLLNHPKPLQDPPAVHATALPSVTLTPTDSTSGPKKVGFSLEAVDIDIETPRKSSPPNAPNSRRSSTAKNAKPVRSILKLTYPALPPTPDSLRSKLNQFSPHLPGSFGRMLHSIIQQLAGRSRDLRLDAYLALNGLLKTYEGVPDIQAMAERIDLFTQYLARDIMWKDETGNLDVNIITQALKLTSTLLGVPLLADKLDADFKLCLVDRSITVFEQPDSPKAVIKAHLVVVAQQRFYSNAQSEKKFDRLLTAMKTIEERCSGNGVIAARLVIYQRMMEQLPSLMLTRISDWIDHVFHGMLSSIKDIKTRAIETCTEAGLAFGQSPAAGRAINAFLLTEVEDGQLYFDFLLMQLIELISDAEMSPCVPQIWAAVVLFFRSKRMPLSTWPKFKSWLAVVQRCLNSGDLMIRHEATLAWNKVAFAIMPDASTNSAVMSILRVPIVSGFLKRGGDKQAQQSRQMALDSYCNLLHYAFRPDLTEDDMDVAWDTFVVTVLGELAKSGTRARYMACRVLHGLIAGSTEMWDVKAAFRRTPIVPEALPKLSPRWIRSRLAKILAVVEPLLRAGMFSPEEANVSLHSAWSVLMQAVADAGSQEVTISQELKQAVATLINALRGPWSSCKQQHPSEVKTRWLENYARFTETMVNTLGARVFAEDILAATKNNDLEVAPTPSNKHAKQVGAPQSPIVILLQQFLTHPDISQDDTAFPTVVGRLLLLVVPARPTREKRLALLKQCLPMNSISPDSEWHINAKAHVWSSILRTTTSVLNLEGPASHVEEPQEVGQGLTHAFHVLTAGFTLTINDAAYVHVVELCDSIHEAAIAFAGDAGWVLCLVEPLSKALITESQSTSLEVQLRLARHVLKQTNWPKSRPHVEHTRRLLPRSYHQASQKSTIFDPFDHVYILITKLAVRAYQDFDNSRGCDFSNVRDFLVTVLDFLNTSPLSSLGLALRKVQAALSIWIRDDERKTAASQEVSELVRMLWRRLMSLIQKLPHKGSDVLKVTDTIMVAAFSSPHRAIVNDCIVFWNDTFGNEKSIEYPGTLERVLRARSRETDISLPTFPEGDAHGDFETLPAFFDIESRPPQIAVQPRSPANAPDEVNNLKGSLIVLKNISASEDQHLRHEVHGIGSPTRRRTRKSASITPKPRLRHDNSQIEFAAIETSPLPTLDESQLMTEHQKEVKARQHDDANIFAGFSSSPDGRSTALPNHVAKRLDFKLNAEQTLPETGQVTPSGIVDGIAPMSDDLPSSPTPSSGRHTCQQSTLSSDQQEEGDDTETNEIIDDPPSSPPQTSAAAFPSAQNVTDTAVPRLEDTTLIVADFGPDAIHIAPRHVDVDQRPLELDSGEQKVPDSDIASDSILPTIQLHQEEEEASARRHSQHDNTEQEYVMIEDGLEPLQPPDLSIANEDVTRIENSFDDDTNHHVEDDGVADGSQQSKQSTKKRKRSATSFWSSKKRKQQSSFKKSMLRFFGQSQEEDEEDIGEEIVVASSQRSSSPVLQATGTSQETTDSRSEEIVSGGGEDNYLAAQALPVKRGRGRPRKSDQSAAVVMEITAGSKCKRKASVLDEARVKEELEDTDGVGIVTIPDHGSQPDSQIRRRTRKTAKAVIVTSAEPYMVDQAETDLAVDNALAADVEAMATTRVEARSVVEERRIATPRGILSRLHAVLADFGEMILGSQEEREFDDVLFALRREVHEAGRRGRE